MKKFIYLTLFVISATAATGTKCFSQSALTDSSAQQNAYANANKIYNAALSNQSPLFTGAEYDFYSRGITGSANFLDKNDFTNGLVLYDGVQYNNVPLLYDMYADKLVALLYDKISKYLLIKYRVASFDISGHHFVHVFVDSTAAKKPQIKSGYYEELYNGKTEVLAKRAKYIQTSLAGMVGMETYFSATNSYFIQKDNIYYSISGQSELLDVLKDRKKELQQFIKSNKIKYRQGPEEAMVKIASYYDHLTN